jgi:hypothetical protein
MLFGRCRSISLDLFRQFLIARGLLSEFKLTGHFGSLTVDGPGNARHMPGGLSFGEGWLGKILAKSAQCCFLGGGGRVLTFSQTWFFEATHLS